MKHLLRYIFIFFLLLGIFSFTGVDAGIDLSDIEQLGGVQEIKDRSIDKNFSSGAGSITGSISIIALSLLTTGKLILGGILLIYIVYVGAQMIMSMGTDEEQLGKSKRQLWYSMVALIFINIPGTLYNIFNTGDKNGLDGRSSVGTWSKTPGDSDGNLFVDIFNFNNTINENIIGFITVAISGVAVFMIVLAGIRMIMSRGQDEVVKESKEKIVWSIVGLLSVGFIQAWKTIIFSGNITDGVNLFETLANLSLFFAGPLAILFLTFAGYYYITANGDEERVKKAKNIVINTVIATILLIATYTFLLDLATL